MFLQGKPTRVRARVGAGPHLGRRLPRERAPVVDLQLRGGAGRRAHRAGSTSTRPSALHLVERGLPLPAYDQVLKCSHAFNLLDARGAISVTERAAYIGRVRKPRAARRASSTCESRCRRCCLRSAARSCPPPRAARPRRSSRSLVDQHLGAGTRPCLRRARGASPFVVEGLPRADEPTSCVAGRRSGRIRRGGQADQGRGGLRARRGHDADGARAARRARLGARCRRGRCAERAAGAARRDRARARVREVDALGRRRASVLAARPLDLREARRRDAPRRDRRRLRRGASFGHRFIGGDVEIPDAASYADVLRAAGRRARLGRAPPRGSSRRSTRSAAGVTRPACSTRSCTSSRARSSSRAASTSGSSRCRERVVVTAMQSHQRYFPLGGARFAVVANGGDADVVRAGNERVLEGRLEDATLHVRARRGRRDRRAGGSARRRSRSSRARARFADKTRSASRRSWSELGGGEASREAARLAKADQAAELVREFPGPGGLHRRRVRAARRLTRRRSARPIEEQYLPDSADGAASRDRARAACWRPPRRSTTSRSPSRSVQRPTGSRDPYGLRRAAIGLCRLARRGRARGRRSARSSRTRTWPARRAGGEVTGRAAGDVADFVAERLEGLLDVPVEFVRAARGRASTRARAPSPRWPRRCARGGLLGGLGSAYIAFDRATGSRARETARPRRSTRRWRPRRPRWSVVEALDRRRRGSRPRVAERDFERRSRRRRARPAGRPLLRRGARDGRGRGACARTGCACSSTCATPSARSATCRRSRARDAAAMSGPGRDPRRLRRDGGDRYPGRRGGRAPVSRAGVRGRPPSADRGRRRRPASRARARGRRAVVLYTLVESEHREAMRTLCKRYRLHYCDLLGHPIEAVARVSGVPATGRAGRAARCSTRATSSASRRSSSPSATTTASPRASCPRPTSCSSVSRAARRRRSRSTSATSGTRPRTCRS